MADTYTNPVYGQDFPDPFVLKFCGEYWAYCTGHRKDGRCFGILHSLDLVHWEEVGGAMEPLPGDFPHYWAPEVSYYNGSFYLYYSVGNETLMEIRVAVANHPAGPFVDSGHKLSYQDFAIDAHVFEDEDGQRYMFYATDFLEHTHLGTGTVMDLMLDPFTLEGKPRPVTRARYDWQVFDPARAEKGGVRWHTVEGPFVLKRKGLYYEMFSGGNWKNVSYGVSYAIAPNLSFPTEWPQAADGQQVLPILRTIPGKVLGPGHNSVVRGPDNRQLYCVYHCWDLAGSGRVLAIDPLDFAGERMLVIGPSTGPVLTPNMPTLNGFDSSDWSYVGGEWLVKDRMLWQDATSGFATALLKIAEPYFLAEIDLRAVTASTQGFGLTLEGNEKPLLRLQFNPFQSQTTITLLPENKHHLLELPQDFNFEAFHLLRLEVFENIAKITLDEGKQLSFNLSYPPTGLTLFTENGAAAFAGFSLTMGWQELFAEALESSNWRVEETQLLGEAQDTPQLYSKGSPLLNYELVVNARLILLSTPDGGYGFYPAYISEQQPGPLLRLKQVDNNWVLRAETDSSYEEFLLPVDFDPSVYQQLRFRKLGTNLLFSWENFPMGQLSVSPEPTQVALYINQASATFEMIRVTAL